MELSYRFINDVKHKESAFLKMKIQAEVVIVGFVVTLKIKYGKYIHICVDDGTGLLDCIYWNNGSFDDFDEEKVWIKLGDLVRVIGSLHICNDDITSTATIASGSGNNIGASSSLLSLSGEQQDKFDKIEGMVNESGLNSFYRSMVSDAGDPNIKDVLLIIEYPIVRIDDPNGEMFHWCQVIKEHQNTIKSVDNEGDQDQYKKSTRLTNT